LDSKQGNDDDDELAVFVTDPSLLVSNSSSSSINNDDKNDGAAALSCTVKLRVHEAWQHALLLSFCQSNQIVCFKDVLVTSQHADPRTQACCSRVQLHIDCFTSLYVVEPPCAKLLPSPLGANSSIIQKNAVLEAIDPFTLDAVAIEQIPFAALRQYCQQSFAPGQQLASRHAAFLGELRYPLVLRDGALSASASSPLSVNQLQHCAGIIVDVLSAGELERATAAGRVAVLQLLNRDSNGGVGGASALSSSSSSLSSLSSSPLVQFYMCNCCAAPVFPREVLPKYQQHGLYCEHCEREDVQALPSFQVVCKVRVAQQQHVFMTLDHACTVALFASVYDDADDDDDDDEDDGEHMHGLEAPDALCTLRKLCVGVQQQQRSFVCLVDPVCELLCQLASSALPLSVAQNSSKQQETPPPLFYRAVRLGGTAASLLLQ
jgi:hypothetical protein